MFYFDKGSFEEAASFIPLFDPSYYLQLTVIYSPRYLQCTFISGGQIQEFLKKFLDSVWFIDMMWAHALKKLIAETFGGCDSVRVTSILRCFAIIAKYIFTVFSLQTSETSDEKYGGFQN